MNITDTDKKSIYQNQPNGKKVAILGGDKRQLAAAREFAADGYETAVYGFDSALKSEFGLSTRCRSIESAIRDSEIIMLPLPYTADSIHLNCRMDSSPPKLDTVFEKLSLCSSSKIFGGKFDCTAYELARKNNIKIYDYFDLEEVCVRNAVPTAEGALGIAINELKITVRDSKVLILGFGRVGKYLAHILNSLGAKVTVTARSEYDLAWISALGYKKIKTVRLSSDNSFLNKTSSYNFKQNESDPYERMTETGFVYDTEYNSKYDFDIIFNTIPEIILKEPVILNFLPDTVYIELASFPGGIDETAAENHNIKIIKAPSLPGKYAPYTAGKILKEAVENFIDSKTE